MADRNPKNPESPLSRNPIEVSSEEFLCKFQSLTTKEMGTDQNGKQGTGFLGDSIVFASGIDTSLVQNPQTGTKEELDFLGSSSSSNPTLQSSIRMVNGFSNGRTLYGEMGTVQNGKLNSSSISNSVISDSGTETSFIQSPEEQRLNGGSVSCSIPSVQSEIPMANGFRHGNTSFGEMGTFQNGTLSNDLISNSFTGLEEHRHGGLLAGSSPLQLPLEFQGYYPQQNMGMETMVPRLSHEDTSCNGTFPTFHPDLGLGCHENLYGYFVPKFSNMRLEVPNSFNNQLPYPFLENNCGQLSMFNVEERSEVSKLFSILMGKRGWSYLKISKILKGDPTLLDEVRPDELFLLAKIKLSSKYLLEILSNGDVSSKIKILEGILSYVVPLMSDQVGNYFFQKVLELFLSYPGIIEAIAKVIVSQQSLLVNAASDRYGRYSIENLIRVLKKTCPAMINSVMSALYPRLLFLMTNQCGWHLIQFFLQNLDCEQTKYIYKLAVVYCMDLATNDQGCLTLKAVIGTIRNPFKNELLISILEKAVYLSDHPYGNFVIQHVLKIHPGVANILCSQLRGHFVRLSMQKCGSHVVETCINSTGIEIVVSELLESEHLTELCQDSFANFVIQKALKETKRRRADLHRKLVSSLRRYSFEIENHPKGRNVHNLIRDRY